MTRRTAVIGLALLLLALLTQWLGGVLQPAAPPAREARHDPDYFASRLLLTELGPDGLVRQRLEAEELVHYPDDDSSELSRPRIERFGPRGALEWSVSGERATLTAQPKVVRFPEEATLRGGAPDALRLETRELLVRVEEGYAETAAPVLFTGRGARIRALGMQAFLDGPARVELLAHVRGVHESGDSR